MLVITQLCLMNICTQGCTALEDKIDIHMADKVAYITLQWMVNMV